MGLAEKLGICPAGRRPLRQSAPSRSSPRARSGNDVLLGCLRALNVYEHPDNHQLIRVNYAALNVEEFGSVYEGLLEYEPVFINHGSTASSSTLQRATNEHERVPTTRRTISFSRSSNTRSTT